MVVENIPGRVTFDPEADLTYIHLARTASRLRDGKKVAVDTDGLGGMVNLDLDTDGRLVGIEILPARAVLSDKLLAGLGIR